MELFSFSIWKIFKYINVKSENLVFLHIGKMWGRIVIQGTIIAKKNMHSYQKQLELIVIRILPTLNSSDL